MNTPPPPPPPAEELMKKIETLEAGHAHLREEMSKLMLSGGLHRRRAHSVSPQRGPRGGLPPHRGGDDGGALWKKGSVSFGHSSSSSPLQRESRNPAELPAPAPETAPRPPSPDPVPAPGHRFTDKQYLNILQSMGQSIHIFGPDGRIIYWNRSAENLYGYSAAEAIGTGICELLVSDRDVPFAEGIMQRCKMGESWTGQFPVTHKMGGRFPVIATNTPFYDDDGTLIGVICVSSDSRPFKDIQVPMSDADVGEMGQNNSRPRSSVNTRLGVDPDQSLQTALASKITNLASKVSNKVRSKMKTGENNVIREGGSGDSRHSDHGFSDAVLSDHREDGNSSGASTPRGDPVGTPFGIFTTLTAGKPPAQAHGNSIDESEGKPGIQKILTSAESWIGKKAMQWSGKGTERETSEPRSGKFGWPWMQGEQDSDRSHSAAKADIHTGDSNRPVANEASGSWSSFNANSTSSASSCGSGSSSAVNKLDVETDCLDYEILWEDLTVGEQVGQGSCGTVYHGLWYGSDVAIKVFSKQEYSEEVIYSFRQEVSLMKRLRHPNILLFMGAVTSPQRLCIVTEFLPRGSLFRLLQRSTSKLDWRRRLHMALDIARGMNYLHNCNPPIIHRDLKSSNLLVDKNWSVKVADFGLSRVKHETYLTTKTGKGTPQWMAPEVLRNERSDEKSDLYSFGVILWELATQKIPWEHLNAMQVIGAVGFMNQRLDIPEDVDPKWALLIESCWNSEPQSRPTFQELLEKLKDMQRQYTIQFQAARAASADNSQKEVL
ncbi:hypothetical protein RND81_14G093200 [Saponaria officinalis]|uniref:non-specific serine/threonine protein kinase n=1 Tax=Saponaria officinalis TaxID=3572 RepID=A0AAW1GQF5_SAPOF